jgi:GNAT superfamily N-acetyltransferase
VDLRPFRLPDLPALVAFWNNAFAGRRNFQPISEESYRDRVLYCPAFEPDGLILAWEQVGSRQELCGLAHAFRPAPAEGLYLAWPRKHELALLYVRPESRRMGVGTRLLHAAERWLYYCPVYVASVGQPCYGGVEGPRAPFFGSSEHMAISARETSLLHFLSRRGYAPFEPGSISMTLSLRDRVFPAAPLPATSAARHGLRVVQIANSAPFAGRERDDRLHYLLLRDNGGDPYHALGLVDVSGELVAHLTWFPLPAAGDRRTAITNVRVAPELRGEGVGSWLLDQSLHLMQRAPAPVGGYEAVELNTHTQHFARAVAMYERRGFVVDDLWVTLVKT